MKHLPLRPSALARAGTFALIAASLAAIAGCEPCSKTHIELSAHEASFTSFSIGRTELPQGSLDFTMSVPALSSDPVSIAFTSVAFNGASAPWPPLSIECEAPQASFLVQGTQRLADFCGCAPQDKECATLEIQDATATHRFDLAAIAGATVVVDEAASPSAPGTTTITLEVPQIELTSFEGERRQIAITHLVGTVTRERVSVPTSCPDSGHHSEHHHDWDDDW